MLNRCILSRDWKPATEGAEESDKIWQTVPDTCSNDRESSVTDSRELGAADNQWWRWTGTESLTSLDICHLTKLVSKVCRQLYTRTDCLNAIHSYNACRCVSELIVTILYYLIWADACTLHISVQIFHCLTDQFTPPWNYATQVIKDVLKFWERTHISVKQSKHCISRLETQFNEWLVQKYYTWVF